MIYICFAYLKKDRLIILDCNKARVNIEKIPQGSRINFPFQALGYDDESKHFRDVDDILMWKMRKITTLFVLKVCMLYVY